MTALTAAPAAPAPGGVARPPAMLIVLVVLALSPCLYSVVAFHGLSPRMLRPPVMRFVAASVAANLLTMGLSFHLKGRLDQRLSDIFRATALTHGGLAFVVLIVRHYFSIPILLTAPAVSIVGRRNDHGAEARRGPAMHRARGPLASGAWNRRPGLPGTGKPKRGDRRLRPCSDHLRRGAPPPCGRRW